MPATQRTAPQKPSDGPEPSVSANPSPERLQAPIYLDPAQRKFKTSGEPHAG